MVRVVLRRILADHDGFACSVGDFGDRDRLLKRLPEKESAAAGVSVAIVLRSACTDRRWILVVTASVLICDHELLKSVLSESRYCPRVIKHTLIACGRHRASSCRTPFILLGRLTASRTGPMGTTTPASCVFINSGTEIPSLAESNPLFGLLSPTFTVEHRFETKLPSNAPPALNWSNSACSSNCGSVLTIQLTAGCSNPGASPANPAPATHVDREMLHLVVMIQNRQSKILQVVGAGSFAGRFPRSLDRRKQQRH